MVFYLYSGLKTDMQILVSELSQGLTKLILKEK